MAVEAGTCVGPYVVHEYIGQGRLGSVYRALDPTAGSVAVKVLHRLSAPECRQSFDETAPRLVDVTHPNLPKVLAHGERDGIPYLVEEYVRGETLAERFQRAKLRRPAVLEVLGGVAEGLDHGHRCGLVHGNLRPAQVILRAADGQPVVTDLGLTAMRRSQGLVIGASDGIAEYLAPEQVRGGEASEPSDRYALATIAYQLLVDGLPFEGELEAVLEAHLSAKPRAPSERNRSLPAALDEILLRGLAKDEGSRWPRGAEMVTAIALALGASLYQPAL